MRTGYKIALILWIYIMVTCLLFFARAGGERIIWGIEFLVSLKIIKRCLGTLLANPNISQHNTKKNM